MEIKLYKKSQFKESLNYLVSIVESFGYGNKAWCEKIVRGSRLFAIALKGNEFLGFGRTVGDGIRFSYIVDLNVRSLHRRKGIGTKLVQILAKNSNTTFVELTNDPQFLWLKDFYQKAGFKLSKDEHVFEWKK